MSIGATRVSNPLHDALRSYLSRFPDAADSPEGIRQWWLTKDLRTAPLVKVREALKDLVASGEMESRILPDGTELYARSKATDDDCERQQGSDGEH
jgi:hypothetical protein